MMIEVIIIIKEIIKTNQLIKIIIIEVELV